MMLPFVVLISWMHTDTNTKKRDSESTERSHFPLQPDAVTGRAKHEKSGPKNTLWWNRCKIHKWLVVRSRLLLGNAIIRTHSHSLSLSLSAHEMRIVVVFPLLLAMSSAQHRNREKPADIYLYQWFVCANNVN